MRELKQAATANVMIFLTDAADHVAGLSGATLTITASKGGGAFAAISPTVTERGNGWYGLALTTAHTDTLGDLALHITAPGADPSDVLLRVVAVTEADTHARLGAPAGASLAADLAAVRARTESLPVAFPANFAALTISPGGMVDANVTRVNGSAASMAMVVDANVIQVNGSVASVATAVDANVTRWSGAAVAAPDTAGCPKVTIKAGTGPGEVRLADGNLAGSVAQVAGNVAGSVGSVAAGVTVADKAGFKLAADGLDAIAVTDPGAPANHTTLARMLVAIWRSIYGKSTLTSTHLKMYANDGVTVNCTQTLGDNGTIQTRGAAS